MKITSAEANKMIRKLYEEHEAILEAENIVKTFIAATTEKIEDARPDYSYEDNCARLDEIETRIRTLKHALNIFNASQTLPGFHMTVDQALVYLPQLNERKLRLSRMRVIPEKVRNNSIHGSNLIEYTYANFDIDKVNADHKKVSDELAAVQNALDLVNSTVQFEIDL